MLEHIPSFHFKLHPHPIICLTNNERVNMNHSCLLGKNKNRVRRLPLMFKTCPAFVLKLSCCPRFILFTVSQQNLEQWSPVDSELASSLSPENLLEMQIPCPSPGVLTHLPSGESDEHSSLRNAGREVKSLTWETGQFIPPSSYHLLSG